MTVELSTQALESMLVDAAREARRRSRSLARYRYNPAAFVRECIEWGDDELTPYQDGALQVFGERRRLAIHGPHALGKTALAALIILWGVLTSDDVKVLTTASAWRQLTKYLWPEVHKWAARIKWELIDREPFTPAELLDLSLKVGPTREAFALASDRADLLEGAHAKRIIAVFDEAKAIPDETWDALEGAFSSGECFALAISTPGALSGRFYDICARRPGFEDWAVLHVKLSDAIAAGRISPEWAEARRQQWGEHSTLYRRRVLGEFAGDEQSGVIPLSHVEAAVERWRAWDESGRPGEFSKVGVDVARFGDDETVLAMRLDLADNGDDASTDRVISELRTHAQSDTMQTTGLVSGVLEAHGGRAVVDVIGIGAGVVDRLKELGYAVSAFNASAHTKRRDKSNELGFANLRAAAWWNLRELLDTASETKLALPPDDKLIGDLTSPRWREQSGGKVIIESKDELRKRLGRSPDRGDAVVMALYDERLGALDLVDFIDSKPTRKTQEETDNA